jgi:putative acetyltransferase
VTIPDLIIRRATTRDAAEFARAMGEPAVYPGLMQLPFPSDEVWVARLADNNSPAKSNGLHMTPLLRRRHVAHLGNGACCDVFSMARLHPRQPETAA